MPVQRGIHQREARCRSLVRRGSILSGDAFDLQSSVHLSARPRQGAKHPERRDLRRRTEVAYGGTHGVGDQLTAPIDPQRMSELGVAAQIEAEILGFALPEIV